VSDGIVNQQKQSSTWITAAVLLTGSKITTLNGGTTNPREQPAMGDYRAYILDIDGHRFIWAKDFLPIQPDDTAAIDAAKQLTDKHDVEVWEGSRLVARLSPGKEPARFPLRLDGGRNSFGQSEPISLSRVSEFALAPSSNSNPFLSHADEVIDLPPVLPNSK
jgi:hypothetical protein